VEVQVLSRGSSKKREELIEALSREARLHNAQSAFFFQAIAERLGIHLTDLQCSNVLQIMGPMTAGRLAEITGLTTGAVTGVINRLEKAGYARRERDPEDGRRVIVRLVPETVEREVGPLFRSMGEAWSELVSDYDDRELAFSLDLMRRINSMTREETVKLREGESEGGDFSAPLGSRTEGRLVFVSGVSRLTIRADPSMQELYRASFEGPAPNVRVENGTVTIHYRRRFGPFEQRGRSAEVTLNGSIPWSIEIRGGASKIEADLSGLDLASLDMTGGASGFTLTLPPPSGVVPVRFSGGVSGVTVHRPAGTAARVRVKGGASKLVFDEQSFDAFGGKVRLQSSGYEDAPDHYEIEISGGASSVTVDTR
jgi:DNA-binding MarR family transcriptional regulator